jgi:hypothetical protein
MNEMALLRNLRNFEKAGISPAAWREVNNKLLNVERSTQLPFRFLTAHSAVETENAKTICELMLDKACENVPNLEGTTVVFADNSGSCTGCAVSGKSELKVSDAGNILEAIVAKRFGERAKIGVFGDNFVWVDVNPADSCLKIKAKIDSVAKEESPAKNGGLGIPSIMEKYSRLNVRGVGGATETGLWFGINDLIQKKIHTDRIILCSDLCCYTQGDTNCGHSLTPYFGKNATVQGLVDKYRREVNPNVQVYSINLNGGKQAQTRLDANSHALSGWSENVFKIIADLESSAERDERQPVAVPTLEVLRARYRV